MVADLLFVLHSCLGELVCLDLCLFVCFKVFNATFNIKVVSSNPVHGKVYLIQHYVIKFVSNIRLVDAFLWEHWFPPPIKLTTMM